MKLSKAQIELLDSVQRRNVTHWHHPHLYDPDKPDFSRNVTSRMRKLDELGLVTFDTRPESYGYYWRLTESGVAALEIIRQTVEVDR